MLVPQVEDEIRKRAAQLFDAGAGADPNVLLCAYLDRHALLLEVDALRAVMDFMMRHCGEPDIPMEQSGLPPYAMHLMGKHAMVLMEEQQAAAAKEEAERQAAAPPKEMLSIEEPPHFQIRENDDAQT